MRTVTRLVAASVPGMSPAAPKRNVIVVALYLYGLGLAIGVAAVLG